MRSLRTFPASENEYIDSGISLQGLRFACGLPVVGKCRDQNKERMVATVEIDCRNDTRSCLCRLLWVNTEEKLDNIVVRSGLQQSASYSLPPETLWPNLLIHFLADCGNQLLLSRMKEIDLEMSQRG